MDRECWAHRYSTWRKGEWAYEDDFALAGWIRYFETSTSWRLIRTSRSWMIFRYVGGTFPEDIFHIFFHHKEV